MANISEDIQCVRSDTRPPMLDRTDFASWQQRIRLYCRGAAGYEGAQNRVGNANPGQARQIKCYNCIGIGHIAKGTVLRTPSDHRFKNTQDKDVSNASDPVYDEASPFLMWTFYQRYSHDNYKELLSYRSFPWYLDSGMHQNIITINVIGDSVISRVYYVEGLGHNLFSVGQFCDSHLEVAFRKHLCVLGGGLNRKGTSSTFLGKSKRRVAKRRVAKRRVAKRRVAKRRVAKRRVAKRRVAKQLVTKQRYINTMNNLETLLKVLETLQEMDSKSAPKSRTSKRNFRDYTKMMLKHSRKQSSRTLNSIEQCLIERASHRARFKDDVEKVCEKTVADSSVQVQEMKEIDNRNWEGYDDEYNVFANERQHSEQPESINDTYVLEKDDSNVTPDSSNICNNDNQVDQNATEYVDERAALANLIANLTLDTEENKKVLKQLKKANASLTQEPKDCNSKLDESNKALRESNSTRDSCLIALQNKQTQLEKYND
ncbi:hypothetical protein Tco_0348293 [Tanacetum coccineum]